MTSKRDKPRHKKKKHRTKSRSRSRSRSSEENKILDNWIKHQKLPGNRKQKSDRVLESHRARHLRNRVVIRAGYSPRSPQNSPRGS